MAMNTGLSVKQLSFTQGAQPSVFPEFYRAPLKEMAPHPLLGQSSNIRILLYVVLPVEAVYALVHCYKDIFSFHRVTTNETIHCYVALLSLHKS
jgi:hypothetical protein